MNDESRTPETAFHWEEWLRQGLLTPEVVARLQAISRRRLAGGAQHAAPLQKRVACQSEDGAPEEGGEP